jgi:hypothetical protein
MALPAPFSVRARADRPPPDWPTHSDPEFAWLGLKWRIAPHAKAQAQAHLRAYMFKHFWKIYLHELFSRGEVGVIEKSWSNSAAVRKLDIIFEPTNLMALHSDASRHLIFEPANKPVVLEATAKEADPPALEFFGFKNKLEQWRPAAPVQLTPSRELVGFWERGMESHLSEFTPKAFFKRVGELFSRQNHRRLADAFAKSFFRMLSVLANRQKHGLNDYRLFSENGRFSVEVQHQVLDRFPIIPDEATDFFKVLHADLEEYLRAGGIIQGRWGRLFLKGRSLILRNEKNERFASKQKWKIAKILE